MIHVAVMGYGTIGSGVVEILEKTAKPSLRERANPSM